MGQGLHNKDGVYIGTVNRDSNGEITTIVGHYKDDYENNHGTTTWTRKHPDGYPINI
tara:strand:+ start:108 stop:278 length:171 start_codon:yes stop_codon:yes gene_type:complete